MDQAQCHTLREKENSSTAVGIWYPQVEENPFNYSRNVYPILNW
jgi:hypothetical protein